MPYPLSYQLFKRAPVSPIYLCLLLMIILGGGYTLLAIQSGLFEKMLANKTESIEFRATFTVMLLTAYIPMAQYYLIKWSQEHWQQLTKFVDDLPPFDWSLSRNWGIIGISVQFIAFFSLPWFRALCCIFQLV